MEWTLLHIWPLSRKYCIIGCYDTELLAFQSAEEKELKVVAVCKEMLSPKTQLQLYYIGRDVAEYEVYDKSLDKYVMLDVAMVGRRTLGHMEKVEAEEHELDDWESFYGGSSDEE